MTYGHLANSANMYNQVGAQSEVMSASPHRVIQMLMQGALDKIAMSTGFMQREDYVNAGKNISLAMSIIDGLRMSLDFEVGGTIAENLDSLYDYMNRTLLDANVNRDADKLMEVGKLLAEIKMGWDAIPDEAKDAHQQADNNG